MRADLAALKAAISTIPEKTRIPDAQARIEEALKEASKGNTAFAEAIFSEVEERKVAERTRKPEEGKVAYQEAAEAARHRGALAFLHDMDKAIEAYRRATELDPENAILISKNLQPD